MPSESQSALLEEDSEAELQLLSERRQSREAGGFSPAEFSYVSLALVGGLDHAALDVL